MSRLTGKASFRRFEALDAVKIYLRDIEKEDFEGLSMYMIGKQWEGSQIAHTLMVKDTVVACGGCYIDDCGQATAWILTSDHIFNYAKSFFKTVKIMLQSAFDDYGAIRVQTLVLAENETSCGFVERLGFEREGMMRKCLHNGLDRYIYARVEK